MRIASSAERDTSASAESRIDGLRADEGLCATFRRDSLAWTMVELIAELLKAKRD
jgi:hypothetical protein